MYPMPYQLLYDYYQICLRRDNGCNHATILKLESTTVGSGEGIAVGLGEGLEPLPVIEKLSVKELEVGINCIASLVAETVNLETPKVGFTLDPIQFRK